MQLAGGPGLVFIAFTDAINEMPGSNFWAVMFFLMLLTLGLDSLFGALESITTALQDIKGFKNIRKELILQGLFYLIRNQKKYSLLESTRGERSRMFSGRIRAITAGFKMRIFLCTPSKY